MGLDEELEALRAELPACRVTAFVDLSAGLVLLTKADEKPRQEWLDTLAEAGARLLPVGDGADVAAAMPGGALPEHAIVLRRDSVRVYVRLRDDPSEALCCDCGAGADPIAVLAAARAALERITAAG